MSNFIAIIPARAGSKSIPLKNIKLLNNKPLIYWTLKAASDCELIKEIYLATDHKTIRNIALNFKLPKVSIYNRDSKNSTDTSSTEDLLLEFTLKQKLNLDDYLVTIQATSPFTTSLDLSNAIGQLKKEKNKDSLLSVVKFRRFIWNKYGIPLNYDYLNRPRRQDFSGYYLENGAFYITQVKNLITYKSRINKNISLYIMPSYTALELDELEDWIIAEQFMKAHSINIPHK